LNIYFGLPSEVTAQICFKSFNTAISIPLISFDALLNKIIDIKDSMFTALFGYVKAQLILMTITFLQ